MLILALALLAEPSPADTVRVAADDALHRAVETSPVLSAARARAQGAARSLDHARAWQNPQVVMAAENLGAPALVTGMQGWEGVDGQAVLEGVLPLGGDRAAAISRARAHRDGAAAGQALAEADVRARLLEAVAAARRDRRLVAHAAEERAELERFAAALARGAEQGRFAAGDAARARLAVVTAVSEEARRRAAAAGSTAEVARLLGLPPATSVEVTLPPCGGEAAAPQTGAQPERVVAAARVQEAAAGVQASRARLVPDLRPQLGLRRTAGISGLYLGLGFDLPLFARGPDAVAAARAEHEATRAESQEALGRLEAERAAAEAALAVMEEAGRHFDGAWVAALEQSVVAARAGYELGDGTLVELLDSRRARLGAMDERERWRAEVRVARTRAARLAAMPLQAQLLCESDPTGGEG